MSAGHLVWIIDEEWADYDTETSLLRQWDPECEIRCSGYDYDEDMRAFGTRADLILAQVYAPIARTTIDALECCKGIAISGGGYDRVDVAAAAAKGIPVTNVQGYCAEDLADYVLAAMFHINKPLLGFGDSIRRGLWGAQAVAEPAHRLSACTLMVVGCGRIGSTVAQRAHSLGMKVLGYDPHRTSQELAADGIEGIGLREGLAQADFISVNVKLTPETTGLLGIEDFRCCRPTAYLINTSRGKILNEDDLVQAVNEGVLAGAVVDVIAHEPPNGDEPILSCPGITVTPHISYISQESFQELRERTVANAIAMAEGHIPADVVNMRRNVG